MSQTAFMAALTAITLVGAVAILAFIYVSAVDQPMVRTLVSFGVPLAWAWINPQGAHRAPWGYVPPAPRVRARAAVLPPAPVLPVVTEAAEILASAPLPVRVAEILAHNEADDHLVIPERTEAGATENWSPTAEVAAEPLPVVLAQSPLDGEARGILDAFDRLCGDVRVVPEWATDWARKVDATLEAAGIGNEPHKRWRAGVVYSPTGELPKVLIGA
jgi:hypothetical protein